MPDISRPETISRFKKQRFLLALTEDRFRDEVVRPLFLRQGLTDGRDLCGPSEEGKDTYFLTEDKLGIEDVYAVQTKRGKLTLAKKTSENVIEAITQLKTAAATKISLLRARQKRLPAKVFLCASGTINDAARKHIVEQVDDPRLEFLDSEELIPAIDKFLPELWLGIDAELAPYLRKLIDAIEVSDETLAVADLLPKDQQQSVATGQGFVMLQLYRWETRLVKRHRRVIKQPELKQMAVVGVLKRPSKLVAIFGGAGSGKSTSLKRIAYLIAKRALKFEESGRPMIPFLLRAPEILASGSSSLVEHCATESRKLTGSPKGVFSVDDLSNGQVLVLIDALDEIPDATDRIKVLDLADDFHDKYPQCRVIIAARDDPSVKALASLVRYEGFYVSPINFKQAQQIITAFQKGKGLAPEKSQELVRRLEQVHGMDLNPLLVTIFAATSDYSRQDIPANITELFKKFTEMMLGRWDATKGFKQQYHAPLKDFVLTKVAFEMHHTRATKITASRLDEIITSELASRGLDADVDRLRDEIVVRSGLFLATDGSVEFRHLLIQEFFAGRGISSADYLHTVVADPWWSRAVVFYFGEHPDASEALHAAITALDRRGPDGKFQAAVTLGLALQACYLSEIVEKKKIYRWVIDTLANSLPIRGEQVEQSKLPTLMSFIFYYLFGRDAVALSAIQGRAKEMLTLWQDSDLSADDQDVRTFWVLVGLIECGNVSDVERAIADYHPSDSRLLLALHMGCYLSLHVRVCPKDQARAAEKVCKNLEPQIAHLRQELLAELKSELLEVRQGAIRAVSAQGAAASQVR